MSRLPHFGGKFLHARTPGKIVENHIDIRLFTKKRGRNCQRADNQYNFFQGTPPSDYRHEWEGTLTHDGENMLDILSYI
jgi:hypothetical protein